MIVIPHPGFAEPQRRRARVRAGRQTSTLATGDGGGGGDPARERPEQATSCSASCCGSTPTRTARKPYSVPTGNPYVGKPGRDEIYALGLRNPFRFSFDKGRIVIGDVGQDSWEEVDFEGRKSASRRELRLGPLRGRPPLRLPRRQRGAAAQAPLPPPDLRVRAQRVELRGRRCAIIGGVRGPRSQARQPCAGRYMYADFCAGDLRSLVPHRPAARRDRALGLHVDNPSSFGEGANGPRLRRPPSTARSTG